MASVFYTVSSASSKSKLPNAARSAKPVPASKTKNAVVGNSENFRMKWFSPLLLPPAPDTIATYEVDMAGACTNIPKSTFLLAEKVCVKASAPVGETRLSVSGTDATVAAIVDVTTDPQELIYMLPATTTSVVNDNVVDNRGIWRATVHSNSDFGSCATAFFSVSDSANAAADLVVFADRCPGHRHCVSRIAQPVPRVPNQRRSGRRRYRHSRDAERTCKHDLRFSHRRLRRWLYLCGRCWCG